MKHKILGKKFVYVRLLFLRSFHQLHYCKTTPQIHLLYISELNILRINVYEQIENILKRKNEEENVTLSRSQLLYTTFSYITWWYSLISFLFSVLHQLVTNNQLKDVFFLEILLAVLCAILAAFLVHCI